MTIDSAHGAALPSDRGHEFLYADPDSGDVSVYLVKGDICRLATVDDMAVDMCGVPRETHLRETDR